jgi:hypothetical protein
MISLKRKKRGLSDRLIDTIKDWRLPLIWLLLFVVAAVVRYGYKAPVAILFNLFRYVFIVYLLMLLPFLTGLAGFTRSVRKAWLIVLGSTILLAGIYQLIYHESIWRIWYEGEFDTEYLTGLVKAATIVPGASFLVGFVARYWQE